MSLVCSCRFNARLSLAFALSIALAANADAASLDIRPQADGMIEVEASDTPIEAILAELGHKQDFVIERVGTAFSPRNWSGHLSGRIEDVLGRLLDNENFLIEHSGATKSGIARVRVFAATAPDDAPVNASQLTSIAAEPPRQRTSAQGAPVRTSYQPTQRPMPSTRLSTNSAKLGAAPDAEKATGSAVAKPIVKTQTTGSQRRGGLAP